MIDHANMISNNIMHNNESISLLISAHYCFLPGSLGS